MSRACARAAVGVMTGARTAAPAARAEAGSQLADAFRLAAPAMLSAASRSSHRTTR